MAGMANYNAKALNELEGSEIAGLFPMFNSKALERVLLHRVDDAGVWIEKPGFIDQVVTGSEKEVGPKSLVFFLPWHQISFLVVPGSPTATQ